MHVVCWGLQALFSTPHYYLHPFYFSLFVFKVLVAKQHADNYVVTSSLQVQEVTHDDCVGFHTCGETAVPILKTHQGFTTMLAINYAPTLLRQIHSPCETLTLWHSSYITQGTPGTFYHMSDVNVCPGR